MKHEHEATFLAVDVAGLQARLRDLGAAQAFPRTLFTRKLFGSDALERGSWIRLPAEGARSTLALKRDILAQATVTFADADASGR
jgi:adenylate cyclase, class 2